MLYDLPYHYAIASDGTIYEGRDIGVRGAHVASGNTGKIGIIWLGDFNPGYDPDRPGLVDARDDFPTIAQYSTTVNLIVWLNDEKGANYGIDDFGGHSDFNQTSCPGLNTDLFMRVIRKMFPHWGNNRKDKEEKMRKLILLSFIIMFRWCM